MMEALSPVTRRILALGLLVLAVVSLLNLVIVPLFGLLHDQLGHLGDVRFERAQLEAVMARPDPPPLTPLPPGAMLTARSQVEAQQQFASLLQQRAGTSGVHISGVSMAAAGDNRLDATVNLEGPELGLVGYLNAVEQGSPWIRATNWTLSPTATAGTLHLTADLQVAWGQGR